MTMTMTMAMAMAMTMTMTITMTITITIDYCNVAFAGLPQRSIVRLQEVINAAARLVLQVKKFDHISTLMRDELQCLTIGERMRFKFSILVHNCLNNTAPSYLVDKIGLPRTVLYNLSCLHYITLHYIF